MCLPTLAYHQDTAAVSAYCRCLLSGFGAYNPDALHLVLPLLTDTSTLLGPQKPMYVLTKSLHGHAKGRKIFFPWVTYIQMHNETNKFLCGLIYPGLFWLLTYIILFNHYHSPVLQGFMCVGLGSERRDMLLILRVLSVLFPESLGYNESSSLWLGWKFNIFSNYILHCLTVNISDLFQPYSTCSGVPLTQSLLECA